MTSSDPSLYSSPSSPTSSSLSFSPSDLLLVSCPDISSHLLPATFAYETDFGVFVEISILTEVDPIAFPKILEREIASQNCKKVTQREMDEAVAKIRGRNKTNGNININSNKKYPQPISTNTNSIPLPPPPPPPPSNSTVKSSSSHKEKDKDSNNGNTKYNTLNNPKFKTTPSSLSASLTAAAATTTSSTHRSSPPMSPISSPATAPPLPSLPLSHSSSSYTSSSSSSSSSSSPIPIFPLPPSLLRPASSQFPSHSPTSSMSNSLAANFYAELSGSPVISSHSLGNHGNHSNSSTPPTPNHGSHQNHSHHNNITHQQDNNANSNISHRQQLMNVLREKDKDSNTHSPPTPSSPSPITDHLSLSSSLPLPLPQSHSSSSHSSSHKSTTATSTTNPMNIPYHVPTRDRSQSTPKDLPPPLPRIPSSYSPSMSPLPPPLPPYFNGSSFSTSSFSSSSSYSSSYSSSSSISKGNSTPTTGSPNISPRTISGMGVTINVNAPPSQSNYRKNTHSPHSSLSNSNHVTSATSPSNATIAAASSSSSSHRHSQSQISLPPSSYHSPHLSLSSISGAHNGTGPPTLTLSPHSPVPVLSPSLSPSNITTPTPSSSYSPFPFSLPPSLTLSHLCSPSSFHLIETIGSGSFGVVHRALCLPLQQEFAVKILDIDSQYDKEMDYSNNSDRENSYKKLIGIWREIAVTKTLYHPNIIRYYFSFLDENTNKLWIVMPLMSCGSMKDAIELLYPNGIKDESLLSCIIYEILLALSYLHTNGKIHKDIKADNILLSREGKVGLADFGVTIDLEEIAGELEDMEEGEGEGAEGNGNAGEETNNNNLQKQSPRLRSNSLSNPSSLSSSSAPPSSPSVIRRQRRKQQKSLAYGGSPAFMAPEVIGQPEFVLPQSSENDSMGGGEALLQVKLTEKPIINSPAKRMSRIAMGTNNLLARRISQISGEEKHNNNENNDNGHSHDTDDDNATGSAANTLPNKHSHRSSKHDVMSLPINENEVSSPPGVHDDPLPSTLTSSPRHHHHLSVPSSSVLGGLHPSPWEIPSKFHHDAYFDSHHYKSDVWSIGILTLEMAFGSPPHARSDPKVMRRLIVNDPPPSTKSYRDESHVFSESFHSFLSCCLVKDPSKRSSSALLLNHKFFKKHLKKNPQKYIMEKLGNELMKAKQTKNTLEQREKRQAEIHQKKKVV